MQLGDSMATTNDKAKRGYSLIEVEALGEWNIWWGEQRGMDAGIMYQSGSV